MGWMKKIGLSSMILLAVLVIMIMADSRRAGAEADKAAGALTSPPPQETSVNSTTLAENLYLNGGSSSISTNGVGKLVVQGEVFANQKVDSLGMVFGLQRWTGTNWVDVTSANVADTKLTKLKGYANFDANSGFYYRIKQTVWVTQSGNYEQMVIFSESRVAL